MHTTSLIIYAILDIRFFYKYNPSVHIMYTIFVEFTQFWIFHFYANLDIPYI